MIRALVFDLERSLNATWFRRIVEVPTRVLPIVASVWPEARTPAIAADSKASRNGRYPIDDKGKLLRNDPIRTLIFDCPAGAKPIEWLKLTNSKALAVDNAPD